MSFRTPALLSVAVSVFAAIACSSSSSPSDADAGDVDASDDSAFEADGYCTSGSIGCDPVSDGGVGCVDNGTTYPVGCSGPHTPQGQPCKVSCTCLASSTGSPDAGATAQWSCPL